MRIKDVNEMSSDIFINNFKNIFEKTFNDSYLLDTGLMNGDAFKRLNSEDFKSSSVCFRYWKVLILEIWCQIFLGGKKHEEVFRL